LKKKDAYIPSPFPVNLEKEYDGTDYMLFSAQFYLEGFTEVISEGETSPLSIRFTFSAGNINTVFNAAVIADLIFVGEPDSVIPNNYNLLGTTQFWGSILPRTVTVNIPFEAGELPYAYCSKEYDGNYLFPKEVTLNNVLTHLDPDIDVVGYYFDDYEAAAPSRIVGDNKVLRFILLNDIHGNYRIISTQETCLTQIYKRSITVINENLNKEYDGSVYMSAEQLAEIQFEGMIEGDDLRAAIGIYSDKFADTGKYISLTLGGADSINYELMTTVGFMQEFATQSGNTFLSAVILINDESAQKAVGNGVDEEGDDYDTLAAGNQTLADTVYNYRISAYAPANGRAEQPIIINNYRQMVLLAQFRWANFVLNADIAYPVGYNHKPEEGIFCGRFYPAQGSNYVISLPPFTPPDYKKLFRSELTGSITVTIL
jgi:hypothetical protein